jgi:hypothetical protein
LRAPPPGAGATVTSGDVTHNGGEFASGGWCASERRIDVVSLAAVEATGTTGEVEPAVADADIDAAESAEVVARIVRAFERSIPPRSVPV